MLCLNLKKNVFVNFIYIYFRRSYFAICCRIRNRRKQINNYYIQKSLKRHGIGQNYYYSSPCVTHHYTYTFRIVLISHTYKYYFIKSVSLKLKPIRYVAVIAIFLLNTYFSDFMRCFQEFTENRKKCVNCDIVSAIFDNNLKKKTYRSWCDCADILKNYCM